MYSARKRSDLYLVTARSWASSQAIRPTEPVFEFTSETMCTVIDTFAKSLVVQFVWTSFAGAACLAAGRCCKCFLVVLNLRGIGPLLPLDLSFGDWIDGVNSVSNHAFPAMSFHPMPVTLIEQEDLATVVDQVGLLIRIHDLSIRCGG